MSGWIVVIHSIDVMCCNAWCSLCGGVCVCVWWRWLSCLMLFWMRIKRAIAFASSTNSDHRSLSPLVRFLHRTYSIMSSKPIKLNQHGNYDDDSQSSSCIIIVIVTKIKSVYVYGHNINAAKWETSQAKKKTLKKVEELEKFANHHRSSSSSYLLIRWILERIRTRSSEGENILNL